MKKALTLLLALVCFTLASGSSQATSFTNSVDFYGTGVDEGRTYQEVSDGNDTVFDFVFYHNVLFDPAATQITSAHVLLSHKGNTGNGEAWLLFGDSATSIGTLDKSNAWVDQDFALPASLYSAISGGVWALALDLREQTTGTDKILIDGSILYGEYIPVEDTDPSTVPEPGTMMLLGAGFLGLAVFSKRRKNA